MRETSDLIAKWYWRRRFARRHHDPGASAAAARLRLVLGFGLGVSSWLLRMLGSCGQPMRAFNELFAHLRLAFDEPAREFLDASQKQADSTDPYSVYRDTAYQPTRPLKRLDDGQVERLRAMLTAAELVNLVPANSARTQSQETG